MTRPVALWQELLAEKRIHSVKVSVGDRLYRTLQDLAARRDRSLSDYIRDANAAKNIRSFATGGEPGIARGACKNLLATASTREEARTEEIHDADRMERAAA